MKIELLSITPNVEELIETAARTCYQSEPKGNVGDLITKLINSKHFSVIEHGYATFKISEVSRALTHQLVRHRICSFSQQSQRYVNESQFDYVVPDKVEENVLWKGYFEEDMKTIQGMYDKWKKLGLRNEDARFVLPNSCHTEIVMSANLREYRQIFDVRCDKHAQWEIRSACLKMLEILSKEAPHVFQDMREKFLGNS
jgi:thymidylate synthase (FAD)